MRFTILTQYYPPEVGAAQVRLSALARELKRHGHEVQVVTAMPNYPSGEIRSEYRGKLCMREEVEGIPVTRTWIYPATGRNVLKRLGNYFSFTITSLLGLFSVPRADVLFVESPPLFLGLSAWLVGVIRSQNLCLNISDLWPDSVVTLGFLKESVFVKVARWIEHWLYRRSWRICGATQGIVQGIISKGITPKKIILLPNGADIQLFRALEFQNNGDRPHNFVYAGTHGFAHGTEVILHTAHKLRGRRDVLFVLVGDGADKPRLRRIASELKLDNLIFCDPIPFSEIPALLSRSYAALVTVSRGEFFNGTRSAKIFPAMASGRAVIHSGSGEGADLVLRAKAGIVTEPGDADALAEAVTWMIANPDETVAMGIRAREFIEREYSWARLVENWLSQIDDEVASKI